MPAGVPVFYIGGVLVFLGNVQNGSNLHIDLGSSDRAVTLKGNGTLMNEADMLGGLSDAGSAIISESFGLNTVNASSSVQLGPSGQAYFVMVPVLAAKTISGIGFMMRTQGIYTASNENRLGLYSFAAGTLTLIASSADNPNLWKDVTGTFHKENFSAHVDVLPGNYWIGALYNFSAQTNAPAIVAGPAVQIPDLSSLDFPNSALTYGSKGSTLTLPSSQAMSGVTANSNRPWFVLY